jgi:hypothetical protein
MSDAPPVAAPLRRRSSFLFCARAAVLAAALVGLGYAAGARSGTPEPDSSNATNAAVSITAPEPTRVVEFTPGVNWQESKGGD